MRNVLGFLIVLGVMGCGAKAQQPSPVQEPRKPEPTRTLQTGPVEITQKNKLQQPSWTIRGESSRVEIADKASGDLKKVSGTIYTKAQPSATFTANQGSANQANNLLTLSGDVVLVAKDPESTLKADHVKWLPERELIQATGNVTVVTKDYRLGPFPKLLATPDLKKVGTPDQFEGVKP